MGSPAGAGAIVATDDTGAGAPLGAGLAAQATQSAPAKRASCGIAVQLAPPSGREDTSGIIGGLALAGPLEAESRKTHGDGL